MIKQVILLSVLVCSISVFSSEATNGEKTPSLESPRLCGPAVDGYLLAKLAEKELFARLAEQAAQQAERVSQEANNALARQR